jgi:hypothetical protein
MTCHSDEARIRATRAQSPLLGSSSSELLMGLSASTALRTRNQLQNTAILKDPAHCESCRKQESRRRIQLGSGFSRSGVLCADDLWPKNLAPIYGVRSPCTGYRRPAVRGPVPRAQPPFPPAQTNQSVPVRYICDRWTRELRDVPTSGSVMQPSSGCAAANAHGAWKCDGPCRHGREMRGPVHIRRTLGKHFLQGRAFV